MVKSRGPAAPAQIGVLGEFLKFQNFIRRRLTGCAIKCKSGIACAKIVQAGRKQHSQYIKSAQFNKKNEE